MNGDIERPDQLHSLLPEAQHDLASKDHQRLGTILILCACVFIGAAQASVRYATERLGLDSIFISIFRGISQFVLCAIVILFYGTRRLLMQLPMKAGTFLFVRGFLGSVTIFCKYESLSRLPVGIAVSLFSITPVFAAFFGWSISGEPLTASDIFSMAVCLVGAMLVGMSDGPFKMDGHTIGVALAILAAASRAFVFVLIRLIGSRVHFFFSVQALSVGSMLTPFLFRVLQVGNIWEACEFVGKNFLKILESKETFFAVSMIGFMSFAASLCLNRGLQLLEAGNSATLRTFDIPVNFLMGYLVMGELPNSTGQVLGCALVTIGIYVNVTGKTKS